MILISLNYQVTMMKFLLKPKDPLTYNEIKKLGWIERTDLNNSNNNYLTIFEKNNHMITIYSNQSDIPVIQIWSKDPTKITYMSNPEDFRVTMKCPTVEVFKIITDNI